MREKAKSFLLPYKKIKKMTPPAPEYAFALAKIAESYVNSIENRLIQGLLFRSSGRQSPSIQRIRKIFLTAVTFT